jgi:hypothetical protein
MKNHEEHIWKLCVLKMNFILVIQRCLMYSYLHQKKFWSLNFKVIRTQVGLALEFVTTELLSTIMYKN